MTFDVYAARFPLADIVAYSIDMMYGPAELAHPRYAVELWSQTTDKDTGLVIHQAMQSTTYRRQFTRLPR